MKIIHTGDWHIGKTVNEFSMLEDQRYFLNKLLQLLEVEKPDAFIIAGDIYDRSVPPAEAVELLDDILSKITLDLKIPVLAISGNHDSAERLSFGNKLLKDKGLYIEGVFKKDIEKITLKDQYGNVNFYLLPYVDPAALRVMYHNDNIRTHDDGMRFLVNRINENINKDERNILITHGYITFYSEDKENRGGLETSSSERLLSIGGTDLIDANSLDIFNYVALGHLHGPQKVGSDKIRYSGSLLKYSVDEWRQHKSIPIINLDCEGKVNVELREINPLRELRIVRGPLEQITNREIQKDTNLEDYVFVELTDEGEVLDAISKIRAVFPNVLGLKMINQEGNAGESKTSASGNFREKSMEELFSDFYRNIKGKEMDEDRVDEFNNVLSEVLRGNN